MKLIGYWIRSLADTEYLPPQEFIGNLEPDLRLQIADYLDHGEVFKSYRGYSSCRFYCAGYNGSREFADGVWVWPEGLSHYVREHGVILPTEFVAHVATGISPIPKADWTSQTGEVDLDFWKNWCRRNSSGKWTHRIAEAQKRADVASEQQLAKAAAEREAGEGLSDKNCTWAGCKNKALAGRSLCARCCFRESEDSLIKRENYFGYMRDALASRR